MTKSVILAEDYQAKMKTFEQEMKYLADNIPVDPDDIPYNPTNIVVVKVATTGISPYLNEVLWITLLDGNGEILLDTPVKPHWTLLWKEAEEINHITPASLINAPYPEQLSYAVRCIFASAKYLIGYNYSFDEAFLDRWSVIPRDGNTRRFSLMDTYTVLHGNEPAPGFTTPASIAQKTCSEAYKKQGYARYFPAAEGGVTFSNPNLESAEDIVFIFRSILHDPKYIAYVNQQKENRENQKNS